MSAFPKLEQFFSAYFHQDWEYEYETKAWEQVVALYVRDVGIEVAAETSKELLRFVESTHASLDAFLLNELGCYFHPSASGQSTVAWLKRVSTELERARVSEGKA